MKTSFVVVAAILVGLVSCEVTYSKLQGLWTTGDPDSGCRTDLQFDNKNFAAYSTGATCDAIGVFRGTYAIADDVLVLQYATVPDGLEPQLRIVKISVDEPGISVDEPGISVDEPGVNIYQLDENFEQGALIVNLTKSSANSFDGVFTSVISGTAIRFRSQFDSGLYLSYTMINEDLTGSVAYAGILSTSSTDPERFTMHLADFTPGAISGGAEPSDGVIFENVLFTLTDQDSFSFYFEFPPYSSTVQYSRRAQDQFEGVWTAFDNNEGCYTTFQFTTGLFKLYRTGFVDCDRQAFHGVYNVLDSDTIKVAFARSTVSDSEGKAFEIDYTFGPDDSFLELQWSIPGTAATLFFNLTKVDSPPKAILAQLQLRGPIVAFDTEDFIEELSILTDLPISQFEEVSTVNGSSVFKFNFAMIDDEAGKVFASDAFFALNALEDIAGIEVLDFVALAGIEVTPEVTTEATSPEDTTETTSGNGAETRFTVLALCLPLMMLLLL